jgi:hypothetical protein
VYFPLQLVFTSIFSRKFIIYYYIEGLRDEVRGIHTGKPLPGRFRVHAAMENENYLISSVMHILRITVKKEK